MDLVTGPPRMTPYGPLQTLAEGVWGVVREYPRGTVAIYWLEAACEGSGAVGRYLDTLPRDRTVWAHEVLNPRLAGMLERRGFTRAFETEDWFRIRPEAQTRSGGRHDGR